jgi:MFS family permease
MRMAVNLGSSFAPFAGGFIAALFSYSWLFWVDGVTCILAAIYFVNASGKWQKRATREDAAKIQELSKREIPPYRNKNFILFLIATFFIGFSFIQWFHSIPVFIKSAWGFDERYIGMLMAINGILIILIEMPAIHWIEKGGKIKASILAGLLLISFSFLPFLLSASLIFAVIAVFFFTFGEIFYLPLNSSTAINMSPVTKRGDYMAWYWMTWSLSSIAGPVIGLTFAGAFGFSAFWIFACLLALISFIMYLVLADKII